MNVRLWLPTDDEIQGAIAEHLWLDHSVANSMHSCPKYAMLRYINGMVMEGMGRAMSLEAGSALHRAFAFHRLWWMWNHPATGPVFKKRINLMGQRIFGVENDEGMWPDMRRFLAKDKEQGVLHALYTSGFYDEPSDKVRTMSNLEEALLYYVMQYDIEEYPPFEVEVALPFGVEWDSGERLIYLGRADAVCSDGKDIIVEDNKSSTQVGAKGWEHQWHVSHQLTGYMIGASLKYNKPVRRARILGLKTKLPVKATSDSFMAIPTSRNDLQIEAFFQWLLDAWRKVLRFKDKPFDATMYTSNCYMYFTPCMFIPVCTSDNRPTDWTGFEHNPWHPTHGDQ